MNVSFGKNITALAAGNTPAVIYTDPHPMGGMNHVAAVLNIETILDQSSGTPDLGAQAQGSNDGVNYVDVSEVAVLAKSTAGPHGESGEFTYAFIRFQLTLDPKGTGTELAAMTFDLHANLTQT